MELTTLIVSGVFFVLVFVLFAIYMLRKRVYCCECRYHKTERHVLYSREMCTLNAPEKQDANFLTPSRNVLKTDLCIIRNAENNCKYFKFDAWSRDAYVVRDRAAK